MTRFTKPVMAVVVMAAASLSADQASADIFAHIDNLALRIQVQAERLQAATEHYIHTPGYSDMVCATNQLRQRATLIHDLAHSHGCMYAMASHLAVLDAQFHRLEALFDHVEYEASHGHGHVHGSTRYVKRVLGNMETNIHHLRADIDQLHRDSRHVRRASQYDNVHRYDWRRGAHPRSRYGHGGDFGGFTIGNHGFRINFGW